MNNFVSQYLPYGEHRKYYELRFHASKWMKLKKTNVSKKYQWNNKV